MLLVLVLLASFAVVAGACLVLVSRLLVVFCIGMALAWHIAPSHNPRTRGTGACTSQHQAGDRQQAGRQAGHA